MRLAKYYHALHCPVKRAMPLLRKFLYNTNALPVEEGSARMSGSICRRSNLHFHAVVGGDHAGKLADICLQFVMG